MKHSLDAIFPMSYTLYMFDVLFTDEFEAWWDGLSAEEQTSINAVVLLLEQHGVALASP